MKNNNKIERGGQQAEEISIDLILSQLKKIENSFGNIPTREVMQLQENILYIKTTLETMNKLNSDLFYEVCEICLILKKYKENFEDSLINFFTKLKEKLDSSGSVTDHSQNGKKSMAIKNKYPELR